MPDLCEPLLQAALVASARQPLPESTYRLQFHAGFTFRDAARITPYLAALGITHCYASPYLKARPGSTHGYDITDHSVLNPEIGTEEDYAEWVETLQKHGMAQILDVVPNHMGIAGNENAWWNDVLENGPSSPYAGYFDIDWNAGTRPELHGRVLLPVLGELYGKVLESAQLTLKLCQGAFFITYFDHRFPVAPHSYDLILAHRLEELKERLGADDPALAEYESILTAVKHLPARTETDPAKVAERQREKEVIKRRLATLLGDSAAVSEHVARTVAEFNGRAGEPHSFDLMERLLEEQAYRPAFWRVASDEINYRRFFDINELAALSMEREEVFKAAHALVLRLLAEGKIAGVRVDHVDGLYDPRQYLDRLQLHFLLACARRAYDTDAKFQGQDWDAVAGPLAERIAAEVREQKAGSHRFPLYVVVEKILGAAEGLREDWAVYGTSGYYFLNQLNGLFVDDTADAFTRLYCDFTHDGTPYAEVVYRSKRQILQNALSSELQMLARQLDRLAQKHRLSRDFTLNSLWQALREIIACFPVYRSYISDEGVPEADIKRVLRGVRGARTHNATISDALLQFVRDTLLLKPLEPDALDGPYRAEQVRFAGKFQQVTSPVTAKGVEDTAFYVYNRLLSLNEVGGSPDQFGLSPAALHRYLQERQARWPRALSATATHDTKRGEDVRARLNVLSELPDEWRACLERWSRLNQPHRVALEEQSVPDANEEYFLYQTLVGAWPLEPYTHEAFAEFVARIQEYVQKALHEAKVHTSWINPDPVYDDAMRQFIDRILDTKSNRPFLDDVRAFAGKIGHYGLLNSLAQSLVKLTAPGVPDTYQGTELWDFSLVDPDNRRPVDFERRAALLRDLEQRVAASDLATLARELIAARENGCIKLYVTWRALRCRRDNPGLFSDGDYLPVETEGVRKDHIFSFVRRHGPAAALVAVPRLPTRLVPGPGARPLGPAVWEDTRLVLPEEIGGRRWRNVFTGATLAGAGAVAEVMGDFPVALLLAEA